MPERIYCGNGKEKRFDNGSIVTITVDLDTLEREFSNYGFTTDAGKRKIKIKVAQRREVDQYGNSHLVEIDTWKPNSAPSSAPQSQGGARHGNGPSNAAMPVSGSAKPNPNPVDEGFADDFFDEENPPF